MMMIRAKNYQTVSKFIKVMPGILWPEQCGINKPFPVLAANLRD